MCAEWSSLYLYSRRSRRWLLHLLGACMAALLLTLPLWVDSAHGIGGLADGMAPFVALVSGAGSDSSPSTDAPITGHCVVHCVPQMVFPALLLCAVLLPRVLPLRLTTTRFHARLGLPPMLPPPQTR